MRPVAGPRGLAGLRASHIPRGAILRRVYRLLWDLRHIRRPHHADRGGQRLPRVLPDIPMLPAPMRGGPMGAHRLLLHGGRNIPLPRMARRVTSHNNTGLTNTHITLITIDTRFDYSILSINQQIIRYD
eukprot:scaffold173869_cov51-Prasinocladus_malaysianus.AAC.2